MPGGDVWTLEPQKHVMGSRPDFILSSAKQHVPQVAIFTDGWQFHASISNDRLADDAKKRAALRAAVSGFSHSRWKTWNHPPHKCPGSTKGCTSSYCKRPD